jgi:hypothetical protein
MGFVAGDSNLYRYVENDPNNCTDPSGLQELKQLYIEDRVRMPIKDDTFDIPGGTGQVWVYKDAIVTNRKGKKLTVPHIQISFTADCNIGPEWHWIQFAWRGTKKDGVDLPGVFPITRAGKTIWLEKGAGGRAVDVLTLDTKALPYVDTTAPSNTRRLPQELTYVDSPSYDPKTKAFTTQTWHMDVFLYNAKLKKVYYQLQWTREAKLVDGKWKAEYKLILAKPTHIVPDWAAATKRLNGGYYKLDADDKPIKESQLTYPNPLFGLPTK